MSLADQTMTARIVSRRLETAAHPVALLQQLSEQDELALLESSAMHRVYGRYSVLACRPLEVLTLRDGMLADRARRVLASDDEGIWRALARSFAAVRLSAPALDCPYVPGWIGYLGYELGRHIERLPGRARRDGPMDDVRLAFYDAVLVFDALAGTCRLVELRFDHAPAGAGQAAELLCRAAEDAGSLPAPLPRQTADSADPARRPAAAAQSNFTAEQYQRAVARAVEYIAAGDIFQVNLSQRLTVRPCPPPLDIYRTLRRRNPAWYAAYLQFRCGELPCAIASSSPELFLRLRGGRVTTRPIKGTRPRSGRAGEDTAAATELLASPKDNAELAMIIDLLRNDIGKVCRFGSIAVTQPRALETHPTVFHLVGTVEGVLRDGVGPAELLRATFPGGSVTGAPKIRAMEIIDELEALARGVYTGCIGTVGVDGRCEWNIAIRTVVCEGRRALVQAGGGIVADSTPAAEYQETLDKARALLEAIAEAQAHPAGAAAR